MATLPTEAKAVDCVLESNSPNNIQKRKAPSGRKVHTRIGRWDPTSKEWMEIHEETAAKKAKKSSTGIKSVIPKVSKKKNTMTVKKSSAGNKTAMPKETKIATKVSNKKDTVTAKKSSAVKKSAVYKQTKTANEVSSKKDTATTRKSSTGKKSAIPKETKKPGKK